MTDRDLLELIARKVSKMDGDIMEIKGEIVGMKNEITGINSEIAGTKNEITGIKAEIKEVKQLQASMQSKLDLVSEQTAGLIEFRTEVVSSFNSVIEIQKSLMEMYGEHEAELRALRRRPV